MTAEWILNCCCWADYNWLLCRQFTQLPWIFCCFSYRVRQDFFFAQPPVDLVSMQLSKLARGLQVYKPHATNDHVHTWYRGSCIMSQLKIWGYSKDLTTRLWATFKRQWEVSGELKYDPNLLLQSDCCWQTDSNVFQLWPLGFFMGYWVVIFTAASAWTFMKPDVWWDICWSSALTWQSLYNHQDFSGWTAPTELPHG